jgi:hypothetical protein
LALHRHHHHHHHHPHHHHRHHHRYYRHNYGHYYCHYHCHCNDVAELQLSEAVDWLAGDEVFVAASGYDYLEGEIAKVAGNLGGGVLILEEPLLYDHYGSASMEITGDLQVCRV